MLRSVSLGVIFALAMLLPAASAFGWAREAAPGVGAVFQSGSSLTVLPDGSARYLAATGKSPSYANQPVVRPTGGPVAMAAPFPAALGQGSSESILRLSPDDAAGNQLVIREASPFGVGFLAAGGDPAAVSAAPTLQVTQIDVALSGEAAAILSGGSEASVAFRPAGPAATFDTPRPLDRAGKMRSYGVGITIDPDGGVFVIYRTEQPGSAILQAYAPPGGDFGAPQLVDVPTSAIGLSAFRYGQSTDGHGVFTWDESTGGDSNSEVAWALTRAPGGLLGGKAQVATARSGGLVSVSSATATDDGTAYVDYLDAGPISCPNNYRYGGSVLAVKGPGSGEWSKLNAPSTGNERTEIASLASAGNAVGVLTIQTNYPNDICADKDPASSASVQLGRGASLGAPQTIASESITSGSYSTIVRPRGFAVNAFGAAAVLLNEPQDAANNSAPFLYYEGMKGDPGPPTVDPGPGGSGTQTDPGHTPVTAKPPLPAPGKIKLSGNKLTARGGEIPFEASCTRLPGHGAQVFCSVAAILIEQEKRRGAASALASSAKPRVLAVAKTTKVPGGKSKTVVLKLTKLGKQQLAAAKGAGLSATLKVTIARAGYTPNTIERKLKVVSGKAKKPAKKEAGSPKT